MITFQMRSLWVILAFIVCAYSAVIVGCSSGFTNIAPSPPKHYQTLGHVSGEATGSLGIVEPPYYIIPMGLNDRIERAYDNALKSAPGATSLINVTYKESWYWWVIGTARKVTVSGEAIKEIPE
jgi:hypothetical protein